MRKAIFLVIVAVLFLAVTAISFSEESPKEQAPAAQEKGTMEKGMMGQGMMGPGMMMPEKMKEMKPMHEMMMKKMMEKEIVATSDGGVVVLIGNKLLKYDKNLNLKAEAQIKVDWKGMKENMPQMKEKCSRHMGMMKQEKAEEVPAEK